MQFEQTMNPACYSCLKPFDFDFNVGLGILACASPYIAQTGGPPCLHNAGCYSDCETRSCASCDPSGVASCESSVENGQCRTFVQQLNCIGPALQGPGNFCLPNRYPNFGAWFQAVGATYCGP
jgi:hypothetical protein